MKIKLYFNYPQFNDFQKSKYIEWFRKARWKND